jgi:hypothetical protein
MDKAPNSKSNVARISKSLDSAARAADRLAAATHRFTLALVIVALAALGFEVYKYFDTQDRGQRLSSNHRMSNHRMPIADPPLEPDRPDLIE